MDLKEQHQFPLSEDTVSSWAIPSMEVFQPQHSLHQHSAGT